MKKFLSATAVFLATLSPAFAQGNPLAEYLAVPGATTTLPVSVAKEPMSFDFVTQARKYFDSFHMQMGGDHALHYISNLSEFMPTSYSAANAAFIPLERALDGTIGDNVSFKVNEGDLTLSDYTVHPNHRIQGVMMIHKGKVAYETYPGMAPMDRHAWMSPGKATVGLMLALLEEQGKIDLSRQIVDYVPELADSNWDGISVLDASNMGETVSEACLGQGPCPGGYAMEPDA